MNETEQAELEVLREHVGKPTNPRYLLWLLSHGDDQNMKPFDFISWINRQWAQFRSERHIGRDSVSEAEHADFDIWLRGDVRSKLAGRRPA